MSSLMGPENPKPVQALERIMHFEFAQHRKCASAIVTAVNGDFCDVELLQQDVFLGKDGQPGKPQRIKLTNVPICSLSTKKHVIDLGLEKDDEVTVLFQDRSVAPWKNEAQAQGAQTVDVNLHSLSGAMVLPIEISLIRRATGAAPGKMIVGSKDNSARVEFDTSAGDITVKADGVIKLGGSSANTPVADAVKCKDNDDLVRTHSNTVGAVLGVPPLPALSPVGFSKVKAE